MNYLVVIIAFLFGVLATLGLLRLKREYVRRMDNLSAQVKELVDQLKEKEQVGPARLPFKSAQEIENGIAALNWLLIQARQDQDAVQNAINHLLAARNPDKEL